MIEQISAEEAFEEVLSLVEEKGFSKIAVILQGLKNQGRVSRQDFQKLEIRVGKFYERHKREESQLQSANKKVEARLGAIRKFPISTLREKFRRDDRAPRDS